MNKLIDILMYFIPQFVSEDVIWDYDDNDKDYSKFICFIDDFEDGGEGRGIAKISAFVWMWFCYPIKLYDHIECPGIIYDGVTKNFKGYNPIGE